GNITVSAGTEFFSTDQEDSLIRLFTAGQKSTVTVSTDNAFTGVIRISGVGTTRRFGYGVDASTWTGTLTLQRSVDSSGTGFSDVNTNTGGTVFSSSLGDGLDNTIAWYRFGFKTGEYTSGSPSLRIEYSGGGDAGIIRLTTVTSSTKANAEVLTELASTKATRDWLEGTWSAKRGYPSATELHEGRLWWFGQDKIWGSVSDAYESFEYGSTGDAGPIDRSIGYGPVEKINWALSLRPLILGLGTSEASIRANDFGNPITPTEFVVRNISTQGSARVRAERVDAHGIFVQASSRRVYELYYDVDSSDYTSNDLTALIPDIDSNIIKIVAQRQPDTRIHFILADGTALVLVYEKKNEVFCWYKVTTTGTIENAVVLPGDVEDQIIVLATLGEVFLSVIN
ncbi:MAG: hypothetical protein ACWGQW_23290, partial [bacterium]